MSVVELVRCLSTVQVVFSADQKRCLVPYDQERSVQLARQLSFADTLMQSTGDQMTWVYRKGTCKLSETRRIGVEAAFGNDLELSTTVEGPTEDALDVVRELWAALGELAEEEPSELDETLGSFAYQTVATVRLPKTYRELFPGVDLLARYTREGVEAPLVGPPGVELFHVSTSVSFAVGALPTTRATVIEPRRSSKADDRVFYTQSPLRSDRHLAMLDALCALG